MHLVGSRAGWNAIEIAALIVVAGIALTGLGSLIASQGAGAFRTLGALLLVVVPLLAVIIWRNERRNRRLQERLERGTEDAERERPT